MSEQTAATASGTPRWLSTVVLGAAGLFYAYAIWNAIAYLVGLASVGLSLTGWITLVFATIFPALVFAAAYALGRRRNAGELAVALLAGLGLVAVFWLNVIGYTVVSPALLA